MKITKQNTPKRIQTIAQQIAHPTIADIGTDHGYVPIYACLFGHATTAIACDIRTGPLATAKKNISANGLAQKIETRLGYGFCSIYPKEVQTAVIAGMGGDTIIKILSHGAAVVAELSQLVLGAQSNVCGLRRFLHTIDYKISNELFVYTTNNFYIIINATKGSEQPYNATQYMLGKILLQKREQPFLNYLQKQITKYEAIKQKVSGRRLSEIEYMLDIYKEALHK